ncbi:unnamed protein product [Adineta steineri]|uniref:Uncharacterized protein n=1 Tax=Adineta steineri TaxID=433720 RepID=A0A815JU15_9BILA|nr:unnamed protein product [Adineta steineri]CAF1381108.1 unnamed protein product [Adineta steineri]
MSEHDGKKGTSAEPREEVSGTAGLERTVGTTATSTGTYERIGVAPAMPDTGSLAHSHVGGGEERLGPTSGLGTNTGAGGLTTITSKNDQDNNSKK